MGISKLHIKEDPQWLHIFRSAELWENYQSIITSKAELINTLVDFLDGDEILAKFQEKKLAKNREQYELLKPVWFEHAPQSAKDERNTLDQMRMNHLKNTISYNEDGTVNIIPLKKIFNKSVYVINYSHSLIKSEQYKIRAEASKNWYSVIGDCNDTDSEKDENGSDWNVLLNSFAPNNGWYWKIKEIWNIFTAMVGLGTRVWSPTSYPYWSPEFDNVSWVIRFGDIRKNIIANWSQIIGEPSINYTFDVCGRKDMEA